MKPLAPEEAHLSNLDPLVASLLARAPKMNFMQLCRLLEVRAPAHPGFGMRDTAEHEPVRFRPHPRVGFPAGEIASVRFDHDTDTHALGPSTPPTVRTTFMGLYGVDAAMPGHMIDDIVLREEGHDVVEAFLDQFNHRFVTSLYRAWKKYRYPESFRPGGADEHSRNLLCLVGFGWGDKPQRAGLPDSRMLALLGLLNPYTRTVEGLTGVIALAVPGAEVRVDEFFPAIARAGSPQPLASKVDAGPSGAHFPRGLGRGYALGRRLPYKSRAVRVTLRPGNAQQAQHLLPGAWLHGELMAFVRLYTGTKADVHVRMELSSRLAPPPVIGPVTTGPAPRLGWTTVLPAADERLINVALGVYEVFPTPEPNPNLTHLA